VPAKTILVLETGDKISADARLIEIHNIQTEEAALTGESTPVVKRLDPVKEKTPIADRINMVFAGTIITRGRAHAIVTSTGIKTEFGKIARLIQETKIEPTPLQKKLAQLAKWIGIAAIIIIITTTGFGVLRGGKPIEMFLVAIALAVAAVPEGLPAVVTIGLSIGIRRMAKRNALIRNLPSTETLGSVSVICSDKTGTLTHNEMTVRKIWNGNSVYDVTGSGYSKEGLFAKDGKIIDIKSDKQLNLLLKIGALCNDAKVKEENDRRKVFGDPTEGCLLVSAEKAGLNPEELQKKNPRIDEIQFTSESKRMTTIHQVNNKKVAFMKGAPDVVLELCDRIIVNGRIERLNQQKKREILDANENFARQALRVLGLAYKENITNTKDGENDLTFIGLQAMIDPPREEVKESIGKCKNAGIRVIMVTGDHKTTAVAIAQELGIIGAAVTGQELNDMSDKELQNRIGTIGVFARVNPEHKIRIISALKSNGSIVAMTGDGVNDAPALKKADIGIAMGLTGTDVSKEASDMILTDDNFASIVNAIEEGRGVYDNIRKFFAFLVSGNLGEVAIIFLAIMVGIPLPLTAILILIINLVTDGLPATALSADPFEAGAMERPPRDPHTAIYSGLNNFLIYYPIILTTVTLGLFAWTYTSSNNLQEAQTVAFFTIVMFELYQAFAVRSLERSSFSIGLFKNKYLVLAVISSLAICLGIILIPALQPFFGTVSLSLAEILIITALASTGFIYLEISKTIKHKRNMKAQATTQY